MYRKTNRIYQAEKAFGQDRKEQVGLKNKKKTDLRSGAKAAAEKPISNIKSRVEGHAQSGMPS